MMSVNQFTYTVSPNATLFSIIPGGLSNFSFSSCVDEKPMETDTITQIKWVLRDRYSNEQFEARQDVSTNHAALYSQIVCERPLIENHVYETVSVSAPPARSNNLKKADTVSRNVENRLGFARGTHVMTSRGEVAVEKLNIGDRVITRDHGMQTVRWVGSENVEVNKENAPILFRKGAIKNARDLIVSADHRVVVKGAETLMLYGVKEVLIPARKMVNGTSVVQAVSGRVEFFQILTDRHEVIYAEAAASESFMPDENCLANLNADNQKEVFEAFPVLRVAPGSYGPTARGFIEAESV